MDCGKQQHVLQCLRVCVCVCVCHDDTIFRLCVPALLCTFVLRLCALHCAGLDAFTIISLYYILRAYFPLPDSDFLFSSASSSFFSMIKLDRETPLLLRTSRDSAHRPDNPACAFGNSRGRGPVNKRRLIPYCLRERAVWTRCVERQQEPKHPRPALCH